MSTGSNEEPSKKRNSFRSYWKKERYKFLMGLASTAMGVLIALLINSAVNAHSDRETYKAMVKTIKMEAVANRKILKESFLLNYKKGIVYRDFSINSVEEYLQQERFIQYASDSLVKVLIDYKLELIRCNAFRRADQEYKYNSRLDSIWGDSLRVAMGRSLKKIKCLICQVQHYPE